MTKILVVDDEVKICELLRRFFGKKITPLLRLIMGWMPLKRCRMRVLI